MYMQFDAIASTAISVDDVGASLAALVGAGHF